jgi:dolichol-phosphate mannosyltransferase
VVLSLGEEWIVEAFACLSCSAASDSTGLSPEISIVVPTLNEAENLPSLLQRIDAALAARSYELLVIDDGSRDGTPEVCAALAEHYPLFLQVRREPIGGLSGAVLAGFSLSRGRVLVAMDADLQHPPEKLPALVDPLLAGDADFTLGSRYIAGGRIHQRWGLLRRLNSWVAMALARPLVGTVKDPTSGFFALRREVFQRAEGLNPLGYKIALELICKCPIRELREVPIDFGQRSYGHSKLTLRQQLAYLEHLTCLYRLRFPRFAPLVGFLLPICLSYGIASVLYLGLLHSGAEGIVALMVSGLTTAAGLSAIRLLPTWATRKMTIIHPPGWATAIISAVEMLAITIASIGIGLVRTRENAWRAFLLFGAVVLLIRLLSQVVYRCSRRRSTCDQWAKHDLLSRLSYRGA